MMENLLLLFLALALLLQAISLWLHVRDKRQTQRRAGLYRLVSEHAQYTREKIGT